MIRAKVIADSVHAGSRLTTFEIVFPRIVLAEFNTHRVLSRNSASSRAIPVWKRLVEVFANPFVPMQFGKNKAGMQAAEGLSEEEAAIARTAWLTGRDVAVVQAFFLAGGEEQILKDAKGDERAVEACKAVMTLARTYPDVLRELKPLSQAVHKQHTNRVLETYAWHTVIVTGTNWRNFYALRASKMAQPEIREVAVAMAHAHAASTPQELREGEWHLPFVYEDDWKEVPNPKELARISSARCARVSYLTHDGKRSLDKDFEMADRLQKDGHMSPFEHPARTRDTTGSYFGNYGGNFGDKWIQYRKCLQDECDFSQHIAEQDLLEGFEGDQSLVDFVLSLPA